jgi:predicted O-methyltransferase YrrM
VQTPTALAWLALAATALGAEPARPKAHDKVQPVIDRVEKECLDRTIFMIGHKKAVRLAELVRKTRPKVVVECGTAIGYSGLWIARELKNAGAGKLISIEINPRRAKQAEENFRKAGLEKIVTVKVGDARKVARQLDGPIDFLFLDCGYSNYLPCFQALREKLGPGAVVVADNAGIGSGGMKDYLDLVRSKYHSRTEWFDVDLPWAKRDAMEITTIPKK